MRAGMKQRIACTLAALALAIPIAGRARPARADVHLGVEMGRTLAGYSGLGARVDLGPVQVEGLVGGQLVGNDRAPRSIEGALRGLVPVRRWAEGWIGVMAGVGASRSDLASFGQFPSRTWAVEGGLHAEWFALPALSLGLDLGVVHGRQWSSSDEVAQDATGSHLAGSGDNIQGGGTVAFWF
jgi:hypothetical protein